VNEHSTLDTGRHQLSFVMAPMVHWPEVMVTYDCTNKILFSADAFGCFGALNGALFADEVDFGRDYMDDARRYYTNIVGKYGLQVQSLLNKASALEINMICPLHGFVWRKKIGDFLTKYELWSTYLPEENGVMIAYASVYGNTENAVEILSCRLRELGIKTEMFDVSVTPASKIVSAAFKWSHMVLASTTYNAGIFVTMEAFISDLVSHNIQNRTVAIIENGTWAPASGGLIAEMLSKCKNINIIEKKVTVLSSLKEWQLEEIDAFADEIIKTLPSYEKPSSQAVIKPNEVDANTMFKLTYGLFVLTAKDGGKDNGCIINTVSQVTAGPLRISVTVNKANFTHDMIVKTGEFNVSILTESTPFSIFEQFGFHSGKDTDKFAGVTYNTRMANGIYYIPGCSNAVISAKVMQSIDLGTHTLFIADATGASILSDEPSVTYQYYFAHIKPKPKLPKETKHGFVCKICGYVHEGEDLSRDFICPLCKHGADDFEAI
jgi:flavin reductase (DIM6/NTAB) family NADH-FMN oxidoreductase RutF/flavodoxin